MIEWFSNKACYHNGSTSIAIIQHNMWLCKNSYNDNLYWEKILFGYKDKILFYGVMDVLLFYLYIYFYLSWPKLMTCRKIHFKVHKVLRI